MTAAETVGPLPLHKGNILYIHGNIYSSSCREGVLMLSIALEVEGPSVNEEFIALYLNTSEAVRKSVNIFFKGDFYII